MTARLPTERSFGLGVGSVSIAAAAAASWRGHSTVSVVLLVVGTLLVGLALVAPLALRVANRVWWRFAQALGWVNARIILTVFFAVVLTPVGVVMRLFGRNPLRGHAPSNWTPYPARHSDPKHYEHQF